MQNNFEVDEEEYETIKKSNKNPILGHLLLFGILYLILFVVYNKANADDNVKYLSEAIYFESRNQPLVGQIAVGCVIKNRTESKRWGNTVRDVVHQHKQFSYYSDGKPEIYNDYKAQYIAHQIAYKVWHSEVCEFYEGINHYINHKTANPAATWYKHMEKIMIVSDHTFYRSKK